MVAMWTGNCYARPQTMFIVRQTLFTNSYAAIKAHSKSHHVTKMRAGSGRAGRHRKFTKGEARGILSLFGQQKSWRLSVTKEHNLSDDMINSVLHVFKRQILRRFPDMDKNLYSTLSDIYGGKKTVNELVPHFMECAKLTYPNELCSEVLLSNNKLSCPPLWFPSARRLQRRFVFHAGPTNSGKTHAALECFTRANSGVYCAPLRMLAAEIYQKCNEKGVLCDMLTGEEHLFGSGDPNNPADHLSCTVEMADCSGTAQYDVAVIDEAQMIQNNERGFAWTRVILGLPAKEIHICGSAIAVDVVKRVVESVGEQIEVKRYERLLPLVTLNSSLEGDFARIRPGDCLVAFSRNTIFSLKAKIEHHKRSHCAVVYGGLPSVMRLKQAALFNDQSSKVMVASDAIGMGLNLNIRRIIFYSIEKYSDGEVNVLSPVDAKQIAGRAGRYLSPYPHGEVTTFFPGDLLTLKKLLSHQDDSVKQAGIGVSLEQLETFSKEFPQTPMHHLLEVFEDTVKLDNNYFLCHGKLDQQKAVSYVLRNMQLSLQDMYMFSIAPVDYNSSLCMKALHLFAKRYSQGKPVTGGYLRGAVGWPLKPARTIKELKHYEKAYEVSDLYLWLHMRRPQLFPDPETARNLQQNLVAIIDHSLLPKLKQKRRLRHQKL